MCRVTLAWGRTGHNSRDSFILLSYAYISSQSHICIFAFLCFGFFPKFLPFRKYLLNTPASFPVYIFLTFYFFIFDSHAVPSSICIVFFYSQQLAQLNLIPLHPAPPPSRHQLSVTLHTVTFPAVIFGDDTVRTPRPAVTPAPNTAPPAVTSDLGSPCRSPVGQRGLCEPLKECPSLLDRLREKDVSYLRRSVCGKHGKLTLLVSGL